MDRSIAHDMSLLNEEQSGAISVFLGNPGFGNNAIWINPEQRRVRIIYFGIKLACNATVSDRLVQILGFDGTQVTACSVGPSVQINSSTRTYRFAPCQLGFDTGTSALFSYAPLSSTFYLNPFAQLRTDILNLQTTDMVTGAELAYMIALPR